MTPIVLASTSAVRAQILRAAGAPFTAASPGVDEEAVKSERIAAGAGADAVAETLAERKALALSRQTRSLVIGADQTLELDGALFDKVDDLAAARQRLLVLRGRTHRLHAAVAVAQGGEVLWRTLETASLTMRNFSEAFLDAYLARLGESVLSSSGCYHLEGEGAQLFEGVQGDYFAILGLPLFGLLAFLRDKGAIGI